MCEHYNRKCLIFAECCNKYYHCRLCHDIKEYDEQIDFKKAHKIDRFATKRIICKECDITQFKSNQCVRCKVKFADYYCETCNLWDSSGRDIFHCNKCGICRVGKKEEYEHCDICGICVFKKDHKCKIKDIKSDCPICLEPIFDSIKSASFLDCGHVMHQECLNEYLKTNYKCPLCNVSIYNVNKYIEEQVNNTLMPEDLQIDVKILCNDCHEVTETKFHIVAMKCSKCNSYNTRQL